MRPHRATFIDGGGRLDEGRISTGSTVRGTMRDVLADTASRFGNGQPAEPHGTQPTVQCRCQHGYVPSTWERIRAGLAETCGRPGCEEESDG